MRQFSIFLLVAVLCCWSLVAKTHVLVSVAPQKFLVEQIAGEMASVEVIVPGGASPHTYEPTPRQMIAVQRGEIWFRIGESFEARLIPVLNGCRIVDQRDGIDLLGCSCCDRTGYDPHIWLSPRMLQVQARQIASTLSETDPEHAALFQNNLDVLLIKLEALDREIAATLSPKTILVSHPAFGYFCRDYGLKQLSIEMEGREPTPKYLIELMAQAHKENIETVYLQKQYNVRGGKRVAEELGAETVYLDPYAENVIENLKTLAKTFQ